MPARPMLPADDLYARLELPADASFEAIEVAWRALLKQHHPDVAGGGATPTTWRSGSTSPTTGCPTRTLRARYDRERHARARASATTAAARPGAATPPDAAGDGVARRPGRPPPPTPARSTPRRPLARHLDRVERLTPDEIDRLSPRRDAADRVRRVDRALPLGRPARRASRPSSGGSRSGCRRLGPLEPRRPRLGRRLRPGDRPRRRSSTSTCPATSGSGSGSA